MLPKIFTQSLPKTKHKVVLLRHGESAWNKENRFAGWADVLLTDDGIKEAMSAGKILKDNGFVFDKAYTSFLSRSIQTFNFAADQLNCHYIPVIKSWKLNERHYGALQGFSKLETVQKHGRQLVKIWRRSYDIAPPSLEENDKRHPKNDKRYTGVKVEELPVSQSLKTTIDRIVPFWEQNIMQDLKSYKNILVVAHGTSIRAILKFLEIIKLNVPNGIPIIYEFDENYQSLGYSYLGDPLIIEAKINKIKSKLYKKQ